MVVGMDIIVGMEGVAEGVFIWVVEALLPLNDYGKKEELLGKRKKWLELLDRNFASE